MDEGGLDREYRKRRRLPAAEVLFLGAILANALFRTVLDGRDGGRDWWWSVVLSLLIVVGLGRTLLAQYRAYTRVTAAGITARGPVRTRTWAWSELYDIRVEQGPRGSRPGDPQWLSYLYDFNGRRFLLPHLDDRQLADPYAEVSELCLAAAPQRSLDWERRPDVEERILRGAVRRKAWAWGVLGAMAMMVLMIVGPLTLLTVGWAADPLLLIVSVPLASGVVLSLLLQWYWSARPPRSLTRQPH
ncbi:PH domain-containing protein [Streptomyces sp. NPDC005917]|uniref:PH domain-containing protein n=1 Tax=unclassified Streptomyces TaxID=2593676 RepID=UPI0033CE3B03